MNAAAIQNAFAPLPAPAEPDLPVADGPTPIVPVPEDAHAPRFGHSRLGQPTRTWQYRDARGRLLGHTARFDPPDGKEVLPLTWCASPEGGAGWRWKGWSSPRPLYGLDRLAARPDAPVLMVEGEKTADAAAELFPDHAVVTWPGGAKAVGKADWSPLRNRLVVMWPDADAAGRQAAAEIGKLLPNIQVVDLPRNLPDGWDLADPVPEGMDIEAVLQSARIDTVVDDLPHGFAMTERGLVWQDPSDEDKPEIFVAGPFRVLAETRNIDGASWGILLQWLDNDGRLHRFVLPRAMLAGDGAEARRVLLDGGLFISPKRRAKELLIEFLLGVRVSGRATATNRVGWHGPAFVLPTASFGGVAGEELLLQGNGAVEHAFRERGSLEEWRQQVAGYAVGNSRLLLAISAAFAAPLVGLMDGESGGIHFRGASSTGKSTALAVAGSVWGGGDPGGYVRSWRATANGLEGVALGHCDALLCLDELSQLASREAGEVAYMLANGAGKSRSARDGSARRAARWRLLFLSSGEIGLADKVAEDGRGKRLAAGQQVRIVDVPADASAGLGLFEELHGFANAEALARHLRGASASHYGAAAPAFLSSVAQDLSEIRSAVAGHLRLFLERHVPVGADGQVHRVGQRFALVAAGGEIAVAAGVLPWPEGMATTAAARCFSDWLAARGGTEPAEVRDGLAQVRAFILAHGMSRLVDAWTAVDQPRLPVRDIAGFRKRNGEGWDYLITTAAWKDEVCAGFHASSLAAVLAERGLLVRPEKSPHRAVSMLVPGYGRLRLYHLPPGILETADAD